MYERQFGLRENPFAAGHQSKYVYPSREHQEALAHLRFGIENREPFVLITGEVGTGKTTALYDALSEWKSRAVVALITNSALTRSELYEEICMRFGVPLSGPVSKPQLINQLERHLLVVRARGDFAILLIDEAQNLDEGLLEETRLLSNLEAQGQKLLQIFLVGQPELEDKLAQPALRQLRQRIAVHYRLRPLSVDDTTHYIHHRISVAGGDASNLFPPDACAEVQSVTHGIPREINTVAAQALLNAFVEDSPSVRPEHVRAIVRDTGFHSVLDAPAATPATSAPTPGAPPDAPRTAMPTAPAPAAPSVPSPVPPPSAASPVPVSPDAPASTREVRHVPAPAPAPPRGGDTPTQPNQAEGHTMAGVRPAGSTESWQSWMDSLAKQTEESVRETEETTAASPAPAATPADPGQRPAEMSEADFSAVEQEALRQPIGDDEQDEHDEPVESEELEESEATGIRHEFDPNESQPGPIEPWSAPRLTPLAETPAMAQAPDFESAPGFNWNAPAARPDEPPTASVSPRSEETMPPTPSVSPRSEETMPPVSPVRAASRPTPATPPTPPAIDDFDTLEARRVEPAPSRATPAPAAAPKPRVTPIAAPTGPGAPALPMRLRERLEAAERQESAKRNGVVGWLIGAAVLAAIVIGVFFTMRFRKEHTRPAATPTSAVAPTTPATTPAPENASLPPTTEPLATTADTRTTPLAAPPAAMAPKASPTPAKPAATPPVKPAATHASPTAANPKTSAEPKAKPAPAAPATEKPAAARPRFGVSVGSFLAEDRAKSESERLAGATGMPSRVITSSEGDFLVVLGAFSDRASAERAAGTLIAKGKVDEARVVPLGASH